MFTIIICATLGARLLYPFHFPPIESNRIELVRIFHAANMLKIKIRTSAKTLEMTSHRIDLLVCWIEHFASSHFGFWWPILKYWAQCVTAIVAWHLYCMFSIKWRTTCGHANHYNRPFCTSFVLVRMSFLWQLLSRLFHFIADFVLLSKWFFFGAKCFLFFILMWIRFESNIFVRFFSFSLCVSFHTEFLFSPTQRLFTSKSLLNILASARTYFIGLCLWFPLFTCHIL